MNINENGVMYGIRAISKFFEQTGGGPIINRSSLTGVQDGRDGFTYTAAKHAFVGMTKNVASHYSPLNIRCNAIARGNVEKHPLQKIILRILTNLVCNKRFVL